MSEPAWKYLDESHRREALAVMAEYERDCAAWEASKPPCGAVKLVQGMTAALQELHAASGLPTMGVDLRVKLPAEAYSLIEREVEWMSRIPKSGVVRPPNPEHSVTIMTPLGMVNISEAKP